jgi:hypothetical protein
MLGVPGIEMGPRGTAALPVDAFVREIKDREVGALADSV